MIKTFTALLLSTLVVGCASVPMGDPAADARSKQFDSHSDRAGVYIYRNEMVGAAIKMPVNLDGLELGKTVANSFLHVEVAPGQHVLTSDAENTEILKFTARAGENVYVWQEVKMGFAMARSKLQLVSPEEGKRGVMECRLIQSQVPDGAFNR